MKDDLALSFGTLLLLLVENTFQFSSILLKVKLRL